MPPTVLSQFAKQLKSGGIRIVDITQILSEETPYITIPPEFGQQMGYKRHEISRYDERGPRWYWNSFTVGEHVGTHFDAPAHWLSGKDYPNNTVDTIEPDKFIVPAVVIDVCAKSAANPDYLLTVADIEDWESRHGVIPPRHWILMRTDWSKRKGDAYTNKRADGAHTPGPSPEVVRFLIAQRDLHGFGTETIGTDAGQAHLLDPFAPAHELFHGAGRYGLQCLQNLDQLPPVGALIVAAPLKLAGGSGSPLRALALVNT
jgi:kynurenine formamidase